jgi:hypothetical protein
MNSRAAAGDRSTLTIVNDEGVPYPLTAPDGSIGTGTLAAGESLQLTMTGDG